ncbi:MAG: class II fructose-bisphosphate aldolase [Candidatus Nomurabacteria bacterium]|jgi:fructose/tagatose bisphosphate aldolase|nr:class II fructose-bisphosphate aldolase [Candidatus Nomurabacteria bacterium]
MSTNAQDLKKALEIGRPPNIQRLFPSSNALIVSGEVIDCAMHNKGQAIAIAANGRNIFIVLGTLLAAQRASAAVIIEIAKSEGGQKPYCDINFWNIARTVDALCNQYKITVPVAIHADHYSIKDDRDIEVAKIEIPTLFEAGLTSIAIDASHMTNAENLMANIELSSLIPRGLSYEGEVGEIKGADGLSTVDEALFFIRGLNAHQIHTTWIALNNGTTHGIEPTDAGIQVDLTALIHAALIDYGVSGAQHGTSGNSFERLRKIAKLTRTTKANVATALQMLGWGLLTDNLGNAQLDASGDLLKVPGEGVMENVWGDMVAYADSKGWRGNDYKKLSLPFANVLQAQPKEIRERMVRRVEEFVFELITNVFNSADTAPLAVEAILKAESYDLGPRARRIEDPMEWTKAKIIEKAAALDTNSGPEGNFDD